MNRFAQDHTDAGPSQSLAIRAACEQCRAEPARIWDVLEAQGIDVTPGVIGQAIGNLGTARGTACEEGSEPISSEAASGLTVEDVEAVAALAEKAGGVGQLVRFLGAMQDVARPQH